MICLIIIFMATVIVVAIRPIHTPDLNDLCLILMTDFNVVLFPGAPLKG